MKKIRVILILVIFLTTERIMAQSKDSVPARKLVESGTKGDLIIGDEKRKSQLTGSPQFLRQKDSSNKQTSTVPKKKKSKSKGRKSGT
jgi:hypothetical protein